MAEISRLKGAEEATKRNRESLHDMVVRRLARYVEGEGENILGIPTDKLKHSDDEGEFEDI